MKVARIRFPKQTSKLDVPDTAGWQLRDFVRHLQPTSERIKKNYAKQRRSKKPHCKKNFSDHNKALLDHVKAVLETVPRQQFEAVTVSDLHFGMRYCSDLEVLVFLHSIRAEYLFLNGDIIDEQVMASRHDINPVQRLALRRILHMRRQESCEVVRLTGNHDPRLKDSADKKSYAGIPVHRDVLFIAKDGSRTLLTHGDRFDKIVGSKSRLERIGSLAYEGLVVFNHFHKKLSRFFGIKHLSIARILKVSCKLLCLKMSHFDDAVFEAAEQTGARYVLCGHVHIYQHQRRGNIEYINSGDWVEACTALVKSADSGWQLIKPLKSSSDAVYAHPLHERATAKPRPKSSARTQSIEPVFIHGNAMALAR